MTTRILVIFIFALIFGIERQKSHKPVGFGTFIFVAIGSCALTVITIDFFADQYIPLIAAIITGAGFLGAGALIKSGDKVFGFTTAASIWIFAIMGIIVGIGYYKIATMVYLLLWICIFIDKFIDEGRIVSYQKKITLEIKDKKYENKIVDLFEEFKVRKYKLLYKKINQEKERIQSVYLVECSGKNLRKLMEHIGNNPIFTEISLE